jgi:hypothetical protein
MSYCNVFIMTVITACMILLLFNFEENLNSILNILVGFKMKVQTSYRVF